MTRGSHSGDGSSDPASGRYSWWDPAPELAELSPPARAVAEGLARRIAGRTGSDGGPQPPDDASPEEMWEAVAGLHRSLDRARGSAPAGELSEARDRLVEEAGRLWRSTLEAEVRAVREFVGEVAHDVRSPLHSSLFLTDALFREQTGPLTAAQKRQLGIVHSAIAAILRMSDDLVDFSRPEGELGPDAVAEIPFSPRQVVGELEALLQPVTVHRQAELELDVAAGESRVGDPQVLNRVLLNFAANALEAVEEGGTVRVRVSGDDQRLRAVVEDDAADVEPGRLRELLDGGDYASVVRRLEGQTRGLGLVICGRMIRAAEGDVDVERTGDGWTRLAVDLPFPPLETGA